MGVTGQELASRAEIQAQRLGARLEVSRNVSKLTRVGTLNRLCLAEGRMVTSRTVVIATGARYRKLEIADYERFELRNIHYAATPVETARCASQEVIVVGGGNSAGQAALHLSRDARCVHLVVRGKDLDTTMSDYLVQRVTSSARITLHLNSEIEAVEGEEQLQSVRISDRNSREVQAFNANSLFVMIGADPNTTWLEGSMELDRNGFVKTGEAKWMQESRFATSCQGIFAIGDVRSGSVKRVASAVGEGSVVITEVHRYLENLEYD